MAIDYAQALAGGMAIVPDYAEVQARRQQIQQITRANALREQQMQQEAVQQQRAIEREASWTRDLDGYLANPTTEAASQLMLRYPDQAENLRKTLEAQGENVARSTLRSMGEVHALASSGDWTGAAGLVERRIAADRNSGQPVDPSDEQMLTLLRSPDPIERNRALGTLRVGIAAAAGPERFTEAMGRLNPSAEPTTQQRQYEYYLRQFGPQVAANWLRQQTGGTTYVNGVGLIEVPDAAVPDSIRADAAAMGGGQPAPGGAPQDATGDIPAIMQQAAQAGTISSRDAARIRASLGPNGTEAFQNWLGANNITVGAGEPAPVRVTTRQQYDALPSGTAYIAPDGSTRVKS